MIKLSALTAMLLSASLLLAGCTPTAASSSSTPPPPKEEVKTVTFTNPLLPKGADPWVVEHEGYYYYCHAQGGNKLFVSRARNLHELGTQISQLVWTAPFGTDYSREVWAPELHFIDGSWYIYFAADDGNNENHRMYALRSTTSDPQGSYEFVGKVSDPTDKWAIDGTVLQQDGKLYFVWSGWEGDVNVAQNIYIAPMSDPVTVSGERVLLSVPEHDWERIGEPQVNEGPQILIKDKTVHIVYSASGSWTDDYCLGILSYRGGDILSPDSWSKGDKPVFSKAEGAYGPGHCSFVKTPDGKDWIVYHANRNSSGGWEGRDVRAQSFTWEGDMPVFGMPTPLADSIEIAVRE